MEAFDVQMLGSSELAERWGITRQRVYQIAENPRLGRPKQLACGRVWLLSQVVAFEEWVVAEDAPLAIRIPTGE